MQKIVLAAAAQTPINAMNAQSDLIYLELHADPAAQFAFHAPTLLEAVQAAHQANFTMQLF